MQPPMHRWWMSIGRWWLIGTVLLYLLQGYVQGLLIHTGRPSGALPDWLWEFPWARMATLALGVQAQVVCSRLIYRTTEGLAVTLLSVRARFIVCIVHSVPAMVVALVGPALFTLASQSPLQTFGMSNWLQSAASFPAEMVWLGCILALAPHLYRFAYYIFAAQFTGRVASWLLVQLVGRSIWQSNARPLAEWPDALYWACSLGLLLLILESLRVKSYKLALPALWLLAGGLLLAFPVNMLLRTAALSQQALLVAVGWLDRLSRASSLAYYSPPWTDFGLPDYLRSQYPASESMLGYFATAAGVIVHMLWSAALAALIWFWFLRPLKAGRPPAEAVQREEQKPSPLPQ